MNLREAAQLALKALESVEWYGAGSGWMVDADAIEGAITTLRDALAEPVQEPVAVALHTGTKQGIKWHREVEHGTPLYTAPPQRKPLTDEEIHDCWQQKHRDKATERRLITRAIERAHGIGGNDESA